MMLIHVVGFVIEPHAVHELDRAIMFPDAELLDIFIGNWRFRDTTEQNVAQYIADKDLAFVRLFNEKLRSLFPDAMSFMLTFAEIVKETEP